jgi:hypothetical protein
MTSELKSVIKETVQETVREMFISMGINTSEAEGIVAFQADMHYLRAARLQNEMNRNKAWQKGIDLVLSGVAAAIILGIISFFREAQ